MHLHDWTHAITDLTTALAALPGSYRRDRTWFRSCLAHAYAGAGETAQALHTALAAVPDAAAVGRPHAWNELHTTAALLLRHGATEGHHLVIALREHD